MHSVCLGLTCQSIMNMRKYTMDCFANFYYEYVLLSFVLCVTCILILIIIIFISFLFQAVTKGLHYQLLVDTFFL